jgi:hypothetical protein
MRARIQDAPIARVALRVPLEVAAALGVSEDLVREHIAPHLPIYRQGKVKLVTVAALSDFIEQHSERLFDGVTR